MEGKRFSASRFSSNRASRRSCFCLRGSASADLRRVTHSAFYLQVLHEFPKPEHGGLKNGFKWMASTLNAFSPTGDGFAPRGCHFSPGTFLANCFLEDESGVFWLNTTVGKLSKVAQSKWEFMELAKTPKGREWFVEQEALAYANRGLIPSSSQCIGYRVLMFRPFILCYSLATQPPVLSRRCSSFVDLKQYSAASDLPACL